MYQIEETKLHMIDIHKLLFLMYLYLYFLRYTIKKTVDEGTVVYAILLSWPEENVLKLGSPIPSPNTEVSMLGYSDKFKWFSGPSGKGIYITIPVIPINKMPCEWAWLLKLTFIQN